MATEMIFYDGHCGLCHRTVRFVLARDRAGDLFRFAPLESNAFRTAVPQAARTGLPDSIVLRRQDGSLLVRSAAVLHILQRLSGGWRLLGAVAGIVPRVVLDFLYDAIAQVRHRLFRRPVESCPVVPPHLRTRFDD